MTAAIDVDVLVAGAGAAGLAAGLSAAEMGAEVLIVDANKRFGHECNTSLSTAMIPAAGTRFQRTAAIDDSPQRFLDDVQHKTHGNADPVVARTLTTVASVVVEWLVDHCHVDLQLATDFNYPGHSRYRCHTVADRSGQTLHTSLMSAVRRDRRIELASPMRLTEVLVESPGVVVGATLRPPSGPSEDVRSCAVVLATNGFGANQDLVRRYLPEIANGLYFGGQESTGDAIHIAEQVGADLACLDAYQGHGSVTTPHGVLLTWATIMHGAIIVNAEGVRFGNETAGYSEFASKVLQQPGGFAWVIYDKTVDAMCRAFKDYQLCVETGAVRWTPDVAALAEQTGIPQQALTNTLASVSSAVDGTTSDPFGRVDWGRRLTPPYAAVKVTGALFHTQGGMRVDEHAAVLRRGDPIRGLYAAGGAAVGMSGHGADGYLAGNGLLAALGLGYIAGRSAAMRKHSRAVTGERDNGEGPMNV